MRYSIPFLILVVLTVGACDTSKTIPPETFDAVLHGRVTTPKGEPAAEQAFIVARAYTVSCADTAGTESYQAGDFNAGDRDYQVMYELGTSQTISCINVKAADAPFNRNPEHLADTTVAVNLQADRSEPPFDSTRIDVVLRSKAAADSL